MIIQNVPKEPLLHVDGKNIHPAWGAFFDNLVNQLQQNLNNEGYLMPTLSNTQIAQLDPNTSANRVFVNNESNELIVSLGGVFKTITTS